MACVITPSLTTVLLLFNIVSHRLPVLSAIPDYYHAFIIGEEAEAGRHGAALSGTSLPGIPNAPQTPPESLTDTY